MTTNEPRRENGRGNRMIAAEALVDIVTQPLQDARAAVSEWIA